MIKLRPVDLSAAGLKSSGTKAYAKDGRFAWH
jgi:hypothetical protein